MIIMAHKQHKLHDAKLIVLKPKGLIAQTFENSGFKDMLYVVTSDADAMAKLANRVAT